MNPTARRNPARYPAVAEAADAATALIDRAGGTLHTLSAGTVPLGALLGGVLGQTIGLCPTLVLAALFEAATALWILWSPIWSIREIDAPPDG